MLSAERNGYTREQVLSAIHAERNSRNVRFRYDLFDKDGRFKRSLSSVVSGQIDFSAFSTIKRTAKFKVREYWVPEYITRTTAEQTYNSLSGWTHVDTTPELGYIRADNMSATVAPTPQMDAFTSNIPNGWTAWNGANGTFAGSQAGIVGPESAGMSKTNSSTSTFGIQTTSKTLTTTFAGDVIRLSFFFKKITMTADINYVYAMANDGAGNENFGTNATITAVGNDWYRYDSWIITPRGTGWGLLIAYSGTMTGSFRIDEVWFTRNSTREYIGEATSPVIDLSDDDTLTGDTPKVSSSVVNWTKSGGDAYNTAEISAPVNNLQSRYSLNGGSTWSSWANQTTWTAITGLPVNSDMSNLRVQFKWQYTRYRYSDSPRILTLGVEIDYEKDILVPTTTEINYISDRIQPFMEIRMDDGGWVDFPLGVFLLSSPKRIDENDIIYREIEAYDGLIILDEDKFTSRYFVNAGVKYTDAVETILRSAGITNISIEDKADTLTTAREFKIGTSKLEAVSELLQAINYTSLWVDAYGYFRAEPYVSPVDRKADYHYVDDELSIIYNGMEEELDLFEVANSWVLVESNPEKTPKVASRINNDPNSPISTVNVGRTIVDFREIQDVSSQASLDAMADRIKFEASQVFGKLKFSTALVPFHEYMDVIRVRYTPLGIDDTFSETDWSMKLEAGGEMVHEARKVVSI